MHVFKGTFPGASWQAPEDIKKQIVYMRGMCVAQLLCFAEARFTHGNLPEFKNMATINRYYYGESWVEIIATKDGKDVQLYARWILGSDIVAIAAITHAQMDDIRIHSTAWIHIYPHET